MKVLWKRISLTVVMCFALVTVGKAQLSITYSYSGTSIGADFGDSVNGAGDVNGDGFDDFIVGSSGDDTVALNAGRAMVYSGFDGSVIHTILGATAFAYLGYSVSGVGDVDGDGFDDFILSDFPQASGGVNGPGRAHLYSGLTGAILSTHVGDTNNDAFGYCVSDAGDMDADGVPDFAIGTPFDDNNGFSSGSVRVISGATFMILYSFDGMASNDSFGRSVSRAGDVNGDGYGDLIVGAPFGSMGAGPGLGEAHVLSGFDGSTIHLLSGGAGDQQFGHVVSCAGDIDQDGFADVIVGAPSLFPVALTNGIAMIFSGQTGSLISQFVGPNFNSKFGVDVSDCGDVNGDGVPDVLIAEQGNTFAVPPSIYVYSGLGGPPLESLSGMAATGSEMRASGVGDVNGDGFSDIIIGRKAARGAGQAQVFTAATLPILSYRSKQSILSTIQLNWLPATGNINDLNGSLSGFGASANAVGLYGVSLAPADIPIFGFPLLIAVDSAVNLIESGMFNFDGLGSFASPTFSRQHPAIAGSELHIQWFEIAPSLAGSNAVRLRVEP